MTTATTAPALDQDTAIGGKAAIAELVHQILGETKEEAVTDRETAFVSVTLAVNDEGPEGGMHGWITYTDRPEPNKVYFEATKVTRHQGYFAGGFAGLSLTLDPKTVAGKTGTFHAGGVFAAGLLQMWIDGTPVFAVRLPVAGAGGAYWRIDGEVRFSRLQ
ncbi:MAG TPA: hypothetical protein VGK45_08810 [Thermoanaerobaculia bacterium]